MEPISVIILAGGKSRRMGTNKALLMIDDQETLIARVVRNLQPLAAEVIVVSSTPELYAHLGAKQVQDIFADAGPLAGLHAGLSAAATDWSFVVGCDMPLVDQRLVRFMVLLMTGHHAVVPRVNGEPEPLHALYERSVLPAIEKRLAAGQRRVISFFPDVRVRYVEPLEWAIIDPEGLSFLNANTPEDWQRLQGLLASKPRRRSRNADE